MAQLNATVGDIVGNCDKVFQAWCAAKEARSDMAVSYTHLTLPTNREV